MYTYIYATSFNLTIIQVYASIIDHSGEEIEIFYNKLQNMISK